MITINLLSPDQKKELKIKRVYIAVKELVMLVLLFTSFIAIMLITSRYVLEKQLAYLIEKNAANIQTGQEISREIITLNQKFGKIYDIQNNYKKWSVFLTKIAQATPDNIIYRSLKIDQKESRLELQGSGKTRQDLLRLQKNLEQSGLLAEVNLPLTSLISKENNDFVITAKIIPEKKP